jgi:hypothetical protein
VKRYAIAALSPAPIIAGCVRATLFAFVACSLCAFAFAQQVTPRPGFSGVYPGMPIADLPTSLKPTSNIGEREGFVGADFIQVQFAHDSVNQVTVMYYYVPPNATTPIVDRPISLADAWRIHGVPGADPEFALYMAYLQKIEGLIDTRHQIAYRIRFPKTEFNRNAPALFDPATRVERVVYAKDRVEFAFNHQPIASRELLDTLGQRYRAAVAR